MDYKTLEWMGERVDKAREINRKIDLYRFRLDRLLGAKAIEVNGDGGQFFVRADEEFLVARFSDEMQMVLTQEITKLQKELAEL